MAEDKAWAEDRIGSERIKGGYAWRTLRRSGAALAFNSDLPGSDWNLFYGMHSAISRQDKEHKPVGGWYADEKMTPEETLRAYTSWGAYAGFMDEVTGTLEEGKLADITVLDLDILNTGTNGPGNILDGEVLMTMVGGKVVYRR
jgi:predicted amidohydrolase YtcJ